MTPESYHEMSILLSPYLQLWAQCLLPFWTPQSFPWCWPPRCHGWWPCCHFWCAGQRTHCWWSGNRENPIKVLSTEQYGYSFCARFVKHWSKYVICNFFWHCNNDNQMLSKARTLSCSNTLFIDNVSSPNARSQVKEHLELQTLSIHTTCWSNWVCGPGFYFGPAASTKWYTYSPPLW